MNTKRILAAVMSILMLVALCVPALAYTDPYASLQTVEWKPAFYLDGTSNKATYYGGSLTYNMSNSGASATYANGAMHLVNTTSTNANFSTGTNTAWYDTSEKYISATQGVTMDVYMKVENLPKITDATYLQDDGVTYSSSLPSGILFGGLAFQMLGRTASWDGNSSHTSNVTQGVMVYYDNETLGTNAAFIMGVGCRNSTTERPYTFFFNIPEGEYARYTIAYDPETTTTKFYVDGVAQTYDGTGETAVPTVGLMYYNNGTTTGNAFNICLNGPTHASTSANAADYYCDIYVDQVCTYADAITPNGTTVGGFMEVVPIDTVDLVAWMGVARDLNPDYYTTASWDAIQTAMDKIDLDKEDLRQSDVEAWLAELKGAINAREYVGTDKLYIANTFSSSNPATNGSAWTCGSLLLTEAGYSLADYTVSSSSSAMTVASWSRITAVNVVDDIYVITRVIEGAYRNNNKPSVAADEVVPENGFIFAFHSNEEDAAWNPIEGGSQYAAQEFGERNALAFRNMDLAVGDYVRLENVDVNFEGDSTLSTTGTWVHRYADGVVPTPIYRPSAVVNGDAVDGGPQYLARDQFDNFETTSYITAVGALPNLYVSVEGEGSVTYGENVIDNTAEQHYTITAGDTVTLTAEGENFSYWKNAKTGAIVSSEATLTFKARLSELRLVAVFEEPVINGVTKYPVTFKDGLTGKIVATVEVEEGTLVSSTLIPNVAPLSGYLFLGWYADGLEANPIDSYEISGKTTFVARYEFDETKSFKLTIDVGGKIGTYNRRFASLANVQAVGNFTYWTLDGAYLTSSRVAQLSMPNRDCTLTAVFDEDVTNFMPTTTILSVFVDENGNLATTMSRNVPEGYTLVESGVLMTRYATADDLVIGTLVNTVTKGVSTASDDMSVFGFTKSGMFDKQGTWLVRGYLTYKDAEGNLSTGYSATYTVDVASAAVEGQILKSDVEFAIEGDYDPTEVGTEIFNAVDYSDSGYKAFFPSVTQADDGTIMVVYYYGPSHAYYNQTSGKLAGVLHLVKSKDGGMTWSEPEVIVDLTDEDVANGDYNRESRDPNLQKLSDGTIVLTFPVRAPIGKAGLNGSSYNDYWYERAYYMTSTDNGENWSEMKEIECEYLSGGEPFLYDDPNRTTACWVKNGSIAELDNGDLLFPLYGAVDCSTRAILQTVVVKAKNNGDGTLTFYKDWANGEDAGQVCGEGLGNELAVWAYGDTVYGLVRNPIVSSGVEANTGGIVYRSLDAGATWAEYAVEHTENNCVNQPNFAYIDEEHVLVNYSVPLGSVNGTQKRSARPIYGKLFNITTGVWDEYSAVPVFDVVNAGQTNTDMGNPASVLLDDGRIMTVGYSNPSNGASIIVGQFTTVDYYKQETTSGGAGSLETENVVTENFDDIEAKDYLTCYQSANSTSNPEVLTVDLNSNVMAGIYAAHRKGGSTFAINADGKVVITSNSSRAATPYGAVTTKEGISGDAIFQFDYSFGSTEADGVSGTRNRIAYVLYDAGLGNTSPTKFYITPGKIVLESTSNSFVLTHTANTEYTFKAMYLSGTLFVKAWEKGTTEPAEWMGSCEYSFTYGNPFSVAYEARSNSTSKFVQYTATIDNLKVDTVKLDVSALTPSNGLFMNVGKEAAIKALYDIDLPMSGSVPMTAYSDNPGVVEIRADGTVEAFASGVANIIATTAGGKTFTVKVIVR